MADDMTREDPVSLTAEEEALIRQFALTNERSSIRGDLWGRPGMRRLLAEIDRLRAASPADGTGVRAALEPYRDSPYDLVSDEDHRAVWDLIPRILDALEGAPDA
jgi:hypothetical protein